MPAVQSVLLYGVEELVDSMKSKIYLRKLVQVQKRSSLLVALAYRTVSEATFLVVVGVMPINLLAKERKFVFQW